jgi:hypothetical protein
MQCGGLDDFDFENEKREGRDGMHVHCKMIEVGLDAVVQYFGYCS